MVAGGNFSDEIIEAILKRHDIVETVGKYVSLSKRGKNYIGLCPFHSEKSPSFTVSPDKQIYRCFGCGAGGNAIRFVSEIESISFRESARRLAAEAGVQLSPELQQASEETDRDQLVADMLEAHDLAARWYHYMLHTDTGRKAMEYARRRGFTSKEIDAFQIGYAPEQWDSLTQALDKKGFSPERMEAGGLLSRKQDGSGYVDRFRDRLMFPIWDARGRVVAFGGRILNDGQPKYLNTSDTPLFHKSRSLYRFHQARSAIRKKNQAVLFEGYVDVVKAWSAGVDNGIATMGTALTEFHAGVIRRNAEHAVLCYDGDNAGLNAALKSIPILEAAGLRVSVCYLPDRMDPDEFIAKYGAERFYSEIIEAPLTVTSFKLLMMRRSYRMFDREDRLRYIRDAVKLIADLPAPTEREHYLQSIATEFEYSLDTLKQETHEIRSNIQKKSQQGDIIDVPWNNGRNEKRSARTDIPALQPAFYNAERHLLHVMMADRDTALYVQEHLGDRFNVDNHGALAAYLYAYYASHDSLHLGAFLTLLQDDGLEREASAISLMNQSAEAGLQVVDDYIRVIRNRYERHHIINRLKEEAKQAVMSGDDIRAAQIELEIIALERKLLRRSREEEQE